MRTADLVQKAREGDPESGEALARAWLGPVYGVALSLVGRAADAEDLTQEAFLRAFGSLHTLRRADRFGPWLVRIVRNTARDRARRPPPRTGHEGCGEAVDTRPPPSGGEDEVVGAWRRLPEDQRLVVWLKVVDGMTIRDLADLLGTSKSTVDRTLRKGLRRLREEVVRC